MPRKAAPLVDNRTSFSHPELRGPVVRFPHRTFWRTPCEVQGHRQGCMRSLAGEWTSWGRMLHVVSMTHDLRLASELLTGEELLQ